MDDILMYQDICVQVETGLKKKYQFVILVDFSMLGLVAGNVTFIVVGNVQIERNVVDARN